MAMQALLRDFTDEAVDMAQGAFNRTRDQAAPRVLAFSKLIEARAHARGRDARAASAALAASEALLGQAARADGEEPAWIDFYNHARLSADAAEIFRDLGNPRAALTWNSQAATMAPGLFTRSVGIRLAIVGTVHLQDRDLDQGLQLGNQAVDILARVKSARALDYVRQFNASLVPWHREARVVDFRDRVRSELAMAV